MRRYFADFRRIKELGVNDRRRISSFGIDVSVFSDCYILPGFTDVHVHLREPGFLYKETMETGTAAAAAGGFTDIFAMPNLDPCPDSMKNLEAELKAIRRGAMVRVYPYGAITRGEQGSEISRMEEISDNVIAFTDDGKGVDSDDMMAEAMERAARLGKMIVAHCEDKGYPADSSESEYKQLERDIRLVRMTGCSYHICHISTKESVALVREAKAEGLDITCETAPHYLTISKDEITDHGRFKMNPPIKSSEDRSALIAGLQDGTIDMIATDHAPHSREEKGRGFRDSAFGIVGMETAFPVLYTNLVLKGVISGERLVELLHDAPRERFGLKKTSPDEMLTSEQPTFAIWDLDEEYIIDPEKFLSKGRSTPFEGWKVRGRCMATVMDGKLIQEYKDERHQIHYNK
ncbi:MAG: dihydroorotase [Anaerovoracaceae bacterium]|nr:dihydroorotase [Anaerovoracaceae bacterium]